MRKILWVLILSLLPFISKGSLQVSGYISMKCIGGTTYQATVVDYTVGNPENSAPCYNPTYGDQDSIPFGWGDGNSGWLYRSNGNGDSVCDCRKENIFTGTHTYPGPGTYRTYVIAGPRVANIVNMSNSISQNMYLYNTLILNLFTGDSIVSPIIDNPPICSYACPSSCYHFNLGASIPNGDSIAYSLGDCMGTGYYIPSNATINNTIGELSWCNPDSDGLYNFDIVMVMYKRVFVASRWQQVPIDTANVELEVNVQANCVTGIDDIKAPNKYSIYPNPSNGKFTIQATETNIRSSVEIYNMLGERVYSIPLSVVHYPLSIDLKNQQAGIYLYRIIAEQGEQIATGKFVIE